LRGALARDAPIEAIWEGPAWYFPETIEAPPEVQTVRVQPGMEFSGDRFRWLADELEVSEPVFVVLDGRRIVSLCHSSRNTPHAAEAGVETLAGYRGRGYAAAVVAHWAREVRAEGREPLYSTSWDNHASRALARKLGLILYGVDLHMS
jgi:predicted GNAT family acetyltransferase